MAKIDRPAIVAGNDTTLYIKLKEFKDGEYVDDFDLTQVSDLKVELLCSRDNYRYEIPYNIDPTYKNLIICDLKHTYYHTNTSYGINVTGTNKDGKHWTWCMMPREGFLVVSNTSGLHLTDEAQQLSFNGLVGWGISTGADLTNYYTKITIDNLLNEKADKSSLAKVATSGDYNDLTNKPVVKEQVQSDWNENDNTKPDYIKNKPDLSQYIKEQELNNYYNKGEVDVMLNNKVNTSTLNSDYYNKNTVNNLLDSKADTSDLSQVAISGDYNELTNKPDLSQYATKEEVNLKQDTLISGSNIKTINNQSLLGSGNIEIQGGGSGSSYTAGKNIEIVGNTISTTDDIYVTTIKTEDIKIKKTENATVHYDRWTDTPDRYLAGGALLNNELRIGEKWYTCTNSWLHIDTQNNGLISISYNEWTYTEDYPSWFTGSNGYPVYKSTTEVNGQPVYGMYNPDSDSPDFYVYDADNYGINSIYVDYHDVTLFQPLTYWRIKDRGMFINKDNDDTNNSFAGERQVSIGENNNFVNGENKLMVGDNLESEYQGNQLLVGYHNREKNALFAVGNGEYSTSFYPYEKTINNDHSFTIWTTLNDEAFNQSYWSLYLDIRNTDDTQLFLYNGYMNSSLNEIKSYPHSYDFSTDNRANGTIYYTTVTLQKDNNNLGITFDLYTDEQHTSTYNVIASTAEIRDASVVFNIPYKRDAFFVTTEGYVYIPYFKDKNNTYNLGEAIYNLEQRPQPVQSNWNEGDESSLAYIQNKPDLNQYATKEEVNAKQDTLISGSNIKTINGQDILGSGDIVISGGDKPYEEQYLTFEALEDGTFSFTQNDLQYSLDDGVTWQTLTAGTSTPTISAGNKILWKQTGLVPDSSNYSGIGKFSSTNKFNAYGNIMSLYYGDDFIGQTDLTGKDYAFCKLFYQCTRLISAENLILQATILAKRCYGSMFSWCESLVKCPELPATTLADECYYAMFYRCLSLTKATYLPATTLTTWCYGEMFSSCTSLTKAPELPATTLSTGCYYYMFGYCTSLTEAPTLNATTLVSKCYKQMFMGCQNLRYVKCLATDISATDCLTDWLDGTMLLGTFITGENKPAYESGTSGIPSGWNVYTESQYEEVRHYELANVATTGDYNDLINKPEISSSPIYYVNLKWQNYPKDRTWQGSQAIEFKYLEVWNLTSGEQVYYSNFLSKTPGTVINEIYDQFNIKCDFYKDNVSTNLANLTFRNWNGYTWLDVPQGSDTNYIGNGSILQFYFYEYNKSTYKVKKYCNSIIIPILPSKGQMVTSSTNGLNIEVVNALPETPAENTIYILK